LSERDVLTVVLLLVLLSCSAMAGTPLLDTDLLDEFSLDYLPLSAELLSRVNSLDELLGDGTPLDPSDDGLIDSTSVPRA
jgi:hypothetical protein